MFSISRTGPRPTPAPPPSTRPDPAAAHLAGRRRPAARRAGSGSPKGHLIRAGAGRAFGGSRADEVVSITGLLVAYERGSRLSRKGPWSKPVLHFIST